MGGSGWAGLQLRGNYGVRATVETWSRMRPKAFPAVMGGPASRQAGSAFQLQWRACSGFARAVESRFISCILELIDYIFISQYVNSQPAAKPGDEHVGMENQRLHPV